MSYHVREWSIQLDVSASSPTLLALPSRNVEQWKADMEDPRGRIAVVRQYLKHRAETHDHVLENKRISSDTKQELIFHGLTLPGEINWTQSKDLLSFWTRSDRLRPLRELALMPLSLRPLRLLSSGRNPPQTSSNTSTPRIRHLTA
ncbi:MAG: hypothetical protein Q9217_002094 [Psora testacea]